MKSIESISNHIGFDKIFSVCRDEATGKVDWRKVVKYNGLPDSLIDKYFFQLQKFALEKEQNLSPGILQKYKNSINWAMLLKTHVLDVEQLEDYIETIKSKGQFWIILKYAVYGKAFVINHREEVLKIALRESHVIFNSRLNMNEKTDIISWLRSQEISQ